MPSGITQTFRSTSEVANHLRPGTSVEVCEIKMGKEVVGVEIIGKAFPTTDVSMKETIAEQMGHKIVTSSK